MRPHGAHPWTPVLFGDDAEQAWESVLEIARAIASRGRHGVPTLDGHSAYALLLAYLFLASGNSRHRALLERSCSLAIEGVRLTPLPRTLFQGAVGIAWMDAHIRRMFRRPMDGDTSVLVGRITADVGGGLCCHDLITGLTGLGVYALEGNTRRPAVRAFARATLNQLSASAEKRDGGLTWPTVRIGPVDAELRKGYSVGVAHGVAGVVSLLSRLVQERIETNRSRRLLEAAVHWLLMQRLPQPSRSIFPAVAMPLGQSIASRAAWCYGDPGVAITLLLAATALKSDSLERSAIEIALSGVTRPYEQTGVRDAGLCHGASGLAQISLRLYWMTGRQEFKVAARDWVQRVLSMRRSGCGFGGYRSWSPTTQTRGVKDVRMKWRDDGSLLTGAAGVGLTLLAACTPVMPDWDRILLLSV